MIQANFRNFILPQKKFIPSTRPLQNHVFFQKMNAFWVCLCLSAYGRPFVACCPRQHTRLTAPLFHTRRSRRLPKRAFSDTLPYHYIPPLPTRSSRIPLTAPNLHTSRIPLTAPNLHTSRVPHTKLNSHTTPAPELPQTIRRCVIFYI